MTESNTVAQEQPQEKNKAIEKAPPPNVALVDGIFQPTDMNQLWRMAEMYHSSGFTPDGVDTPQACFVILAKAMEIGLGLMQSMESIAVINGKAAIWGDAITALIHRSGLLEEWEETYEGEPGTDEWACVCRMKRKGSIAISNRFSLGDAKQAGLMSKIPWQRYTARMMKMRARGFTSRDLFSDVLGGMYLAEELIGGDSFDPNQMRVKVENDAADDSRTQMEKMKDRIKGRKGAESIEPDCGPDEDMKPDHDLLIDPDPDDSVEEDPEPTKEDLVDAGLA